MQNLWRDSSFVIFWLGRSVSMAGSMITAVILPILTYQITGSPFQTALLTTIEITPYFVFGLFAGALADRVDRRRLMVACDLINALLLASIPVTAFFGRLTITQIYIVAPLVMFVYVWFDAANFGALPALVGSERIAQANSILVSTETLLGILIPALSGAFIVIMGATNALWLDSASFFVSAICLLMSRKAFNTKRETGNESSSVIRRFLNDIAEGFSFLWKQQTVRALTFLGFGVSFTNGAVTSLLIVYAVQRLGLMSEDARIGWIYSAGAIGSLLASLVLPKLIRWQAPGRITVFSLLFAILFLLSVVISPFFEFGLVSYLAYSFVITLIIVNGITLRQMVTPDHLQSRVNTTARIIAWGGTPFGAVIAGVLAQRFNVQIAYAIMGIGLLVSATIGWFSPLREETKENNIIQNKEDG